jgi:hypothetical protein
VATVHASSEQLGVAADPQVKAICVVATSSLPFKVAIAGSKTTR